MIIDATPIATTGLDIAIWVMLVVGCTGLVLCLIALVIDPHPRSPALAGTGFVMSILGAVVSLILIFTNMPHQEAAREAQIREVVEEAGYASYEGSLPHDQVAVRDQDGQPVILLVTHIDGDRYLVVELDESFD